jgi:density-regulated protein DRP1
MEEAKEISNLRKVQVLYCAACSLPHEYCCYGGDLAQCLPHIFKHAPQVLDNPVKIAEAKAANEAVRAKLRKETKKKDDSSASETTAVAEAAPVAVASEGGEEGEKTAPKKKKETSEEKKKKGPKVVVSRLSRSKRKFLTLVSGLDGFGVVPKDACSIFKKKFACGVSQVKGSSSVCLFVFILS